MDKSRLSLGRKRKVSEQSGQALVNNTRNKQRRVVNEDDALSKTEHPKIEHDKVWKQMQATTFWNTCLF
jgi:hypothetical protein